MSEEQRKIDRLVHEMGFNTMEAKMALQDTNGDIDMAVNKLMNGEYSPPPYSSSSASAEPQHDAKQDAIKKQSAIPKLISDITHRQKFDIPKYEEHPSAPSILDIGTKPPGNEVGIESLPPPYEKIEKLSRIRLWEQESNVKHLNDDLSSISSADVSLWCRERCEVCFSKFLKGDDAADVKKLMQENLVQQGGKVCDKLLFGKGPSAFGFRHA